MPLRMGDDSATRRISIRLKSEWPVRTRKAFAGSRAGGLDPNRFDQQAVMRPSRFTPQKNLFAWDSLAPLFQKRKTLTGRLRHPHPRRSLIYFVVAVSLNLTPAAGQRFMFAHLNPEPGNAASGRIQE